MRAHCLYTKNVKTEFRLGHPDDTHTWSHASERPTQNILLIAKQRNVSFKIPIPIAKQKNSLMFSSNLTHVKKEKVQYIEKSPVKNYKILFVMILCIF